MQPVAYNGREKYEMPLSANLTFLTAQQFLFDLLW